MNPTGRIEKVDESESEEDEIYRKSELWFSLLIRLMGHNQSEAEQNWRKKQLEKL